MNNTMNDISAPAPASVSSGGQSSWWTTLPGLFTAAGGFITALAGLLVGLNAAGIVPVRTQPTGPAQGTQYRTASLADAYTVTSAVTAFDADGGRVTKWIVQCGNARSTSENGRRFILYGYFDANGAPRTDSPYRISQHRFSDWHDGARLVCHLQT
jgi:hypothetical protein